MLQAIKTLCKASVGIYGDGPTQMWSALLLALVFGLVGVAFPPAVGVAVLFALLAVVGFIRLLVAGIRYGRSASD